MRWAVLRRLAVKDKTDGRSLGKKGIFQILVDCAYAMELSLLERRIHLFELTTLSTSCNGYGQAYQGKSLVLWALVSSG